MRPGQAKGPSTQSGAGGGGGGGSVTSTFTAGNIPVATSATNLGNGLLSQSAGVLIVGGGINLGSGNFTVAFASGNVVTAGSLSVGTTLGVTGVATFTDLAGSGTRMVVASATGVLSTQAIPSGGSLANPTGTIGLTAVNGVLTTGLRSDGAPALSQAIVPTWSGIHTFTLQPIFSSVTASTAAAFDGSKGLVSVANTGTGNNVLSASPTLTGTIGAASMTLSGTLAVAGITSYTGGAGVAFNAGASGHYYAQITANNQIALNSAGDYGFISNTAANTWALGYGTTPTTLGTSALTWNTSGLVTIVGTFAVTGVQSNSEALAFVANGTGGNGRIYKSSGGGLTMRAIAGSTYDFTVESASGNNILVNPTGTTEVLFPAAGGVTVTALAGSGTRMVVASATGVLSTQSIPAGASLADPTGTIGLTAVNGVLTSGMRSDGAPALSQAIVPTWSGIHTFTLQPIFSSVTASTAAAFDSSKGLVSVANTGTGNNVLSASPTLTGTVIAAAATLSGVLTLNATGTGTSSALLMSAAAPTATWVASGAGSNEKVWDLTFGNTTMDFRTRTDAHGAGVTWLGLTRTGTSVTTAHFRVDSVGTSTILTLDGANVLRGGSTTNGAIGTINSYVAINSFGLMSHLATLSTDVALTSSGGALAVDAALADNFTCVLSENTTVSAPTNPAAGRIIRFRFRQAAGNYTLAWNGVFNDMGNEITAMTTTSGEFGYYAFKWNEVTDTWDYLGATVFAAT